MSPISRKTAMFFSFLSLILLLALVVSVNYWSMFSTAFLPPTPGGQTQSSTSSSSSQSSISGKTCCVCVYEEVPACSGYATQAACETTECNDGLDNDSDALIDGADPGCQDGNGVPVAFDNGESGSGVQKKDCAWDDPSCKSRFENSCQTWLNTDPQLSECDTEQVIRENESFTLDQCSTVRYARYSHDSSAGCDEVFRELWGCVSCATASCTNPQIIAQFSGCSLFKDMEEVMQRSQILQGLLLPGERVVVNAPHSVSSEACTVTTTVDITTEAITVTPNNCHPVGSFCNAEVPPRSLGCMDAGTPAMEICCPNAGHTSNEWKRGISC